MIVLYNKNIKENTNEISITDPDIAPATKLNPKEGTLLGPA